MTKYNRIESYIIVKIKGIVKTGRGESSQWMPIYLSWLVPGTLNLKLQGKISTIKWTKIIDTHYGKPCKICPCKINGVDAFLIHPPLGKENKSKVEIGAVFKIRKKFNLQDNDIVEIEFLNF